MSMVCERVQEGRGQAHVGVCGQGEGPKP